MRYLFFSCICLCYLNLMSCYTPLSYKLLALRANSHYWEGVLGKDTIKVKNVVADLRKGVISVGDSSALFEGFKGVEFDLNGVSSMYQLSYNIDTLEFWQINIFHSLSDEEGKAYIDSLAKNDASFNLKLTQKPYNPNYSPSRYEQKLLKKIGYPQQSN